MRATRVLYPDGQPDVYLKMNQTEASRLVEDLKILIGAYAPDDVPMPAEAVIAELERVLAQASGTRSGT